MLMNYCISYLRFPSPSNLLCKSHHVPQYTNSNLDIPCHVTCHLQIIQFDNAPDNDTPCYTQLVTTNVLIMYHVLTHLTM